VFTLLETDDPELIRRVLHGHQYRTGVRLAELRVILQNLQPLLDGKESVMDTPVDGIDHRRLGVDLFNKTWTLMEKEARTPEETEEMLHCAHASSYHWMQVGTQANRARSEWQCSRVYTVLGRAEPRATRAAARIWRAGGGGLGLPFVWALHAVAGNRPSQTLSREGARGRREIEGEEERRLLEADLATVQSAASSSSSAPRPRMADQGELEPVRADPVTRPAGRLGNDGVRAGQDLVRLDGLPLEHLAAGPEHLPCGFSSRTRSGPSRAPAFSSSSVGTASSAIRRNSRPIVSTASSARAMSTPAWE
jgi:hypothetical protein